MVAKVADRRRHEGTVLCGTRYGNVMASRGSVIPLFIEQIKAGKPLTVTDPEHDPLHDVASTTPSIWCSSPSSTRSPGDIFVQKAPAATIGTLAEAMKIVFNADNPIQVIGTRHGEKLYETLLTREEMAKAEDLGDYYRVPADNRDLNYNAFFTEGAEEISSMEDFTSDNAHRMNVEEMAELLLKLPVHQIGTGRLFPREEPIPIISS